MQIASEGLNDRYPSWFTFESAINISKFNEHFVISEFNSIKNEHQLSSTIKDCNFASAAYFIRNDF